MFVAEFSSEHYSAHSFLPREEIKDHDRILAMIKKMTAPLVVLFILISSPVYSGTKAKRELKNQVTTTQDSNTLLYDEHSLGGKTEVRFKPITPTGQIKNRNLKDKMTYGLTGSTYVRNVMQEDGASHYESVSKQKIFNYKQKFSLAAAQVGYSGNKNKSKVDGSAVVAVCDGIPDGASNSGGRVGFEHKKKIYAFSQQLCSEAAQIINQYTDPEKLIKALPGIVKELKKKSGSENSTLTLGKAFPVKSGYRYVGINVGDSGVIGVRRNDQNERRDKKGERNGKPVWEYSEVSTPSTGAKRNGIRDIENVSIIDAKDIKKGTVLVGLTWEPFQSVGSQGATLTGKLLGQQSNPATIVEAIRGTTVDKAQKDRKQNILGLDPLIAAQNQCLEEIEASGKKIKEFQKGGADCGFLERRNEIKTNELRDAKAKIQEKAESQGSDFVAVGITLP